MFTLTVEELLNSQASLQKLTDNAAIAPAIKLRLVPIKRSYDQHAKDAQDARLDLFKHFGTPVEDRPGDYEVKPDAPPENKQAITDGWKAILAESVQIPGKKIPFETISGAPLSTADLLNLEWLIEIPAEQEAEAPATAAAASA